MHLRFTIRDARSGTESDVELRCSPGVPLDEVVDALKSAVPFSGPMTVDGHELSGNVTLRDSPLLPGALVTVGGPGRPRTRPDPAAGSALRVVSGPSAGAVLELPSGRPFVIGRDPEADLPLLDTDVSRRHARVVLDGDRIRVQDLQSTNGTWIGGERCTEGVVEHGASFQVGGSRLELFRSGSARAALAPDPEVGQVVSPRFRVRTAAPHAQVELPAVPAEAPGRALPVLGIVAPLLIAVLLAWITGHAQYLLFAVLSPVTLVASHVADRRGDRARKRRERRTYDETVARAVARAVEAADEEDAYLRESWPDPASVVRIATVPEVQLWERRPTDDDWLHIRLGSCDLPASVEVKGPKPASWPELVLRDAPVGVSLRSTPVLGVAGAIGPTSALVRSVLVQLAALHSPDDVRFAVIAPGATVGELGWARWLPHSRTDDGRSLTAWDDHQTDALTKWLTTTLEQRRGQDGRPLERSEHLPRVVVVLAGPGAAALLRARPALVHLLKAGPAVGMSFVCVDRDDRLLPAECTAAVVIRDSARGELRITDGPARSLTLADTSAADADDAARSLARLRPIRSAAGGRALPDLVRLVDLTGEPETEAVRAGWRLAPESTAVPIGVDVEGTYVLDLARQGPHALLAGATGMGKSELVQTLVAALAQANDPHHLNFVFIDWAGGPSFRVLKELPHVAGNVSNLDERTVVRALTSLQAELDRRQALLAGHAADNRAAYLEKAAADRSLPPLPRLVVVVDEFAELKDKAPDVLKGFVSVARIGRKLGMHLLLCTQDPARAVDPQVKTNSDLRISLRLPDASTSMDVIDSPLAADLPQTPKGRAYVRAGDLQPRLIQTAISTLPARVGGSDGPIVTLLRWSDTGTAAGPQATGRESDLERLVEVLRRAAAAEGLTAPHQLWTPPLPDVLPLGDLPGRSGALTLGLRDLPARQRQEVLLLPLATEHLAVVGSAGTGRTTALRTFAASAMRTTPPDRLHVHVLDGGGGLAGLAGFPHVGVVARPEEEERVDRFLERLDEVARTRRRVLADAGMTSVAEQRALAPDTAPADLLLLVDGWDRFFDPTLQRTSRLLSVLDNGIAAGVTVVVAGDEAMLRARLQARVPAALYLRLNNSNDWPGRLRPTGLTEGRALWAGDGSEVQIPVLGSTADGPTQARSLRDLAEVARSAWPAVDPDRGPLRLDPLPDSMSLTTAWQLAPPPGDRPHVLLGVGGDRLAPRWAPLDGTPIVIAGPPRSGRSTAVASVAAALARQGVSVLVVAARSSAGHPAQGAGVPVVSLAEATAALGHDRPQVVLVDDADRGELPPELSTALSAASGPTVVVSATLESFALGGGSLQRAALRGARTVVALCPLDRGGARNVGVVLAPGQSLTGPAGRAVAMVDGVSELLQVALPG